MKWFSWEKEGLLFTKQLNLKLYRSQKGLGGNISISANRYRLFVKPLF